MGPFEVRPIGVVRSPFAEKAQAPRQAVAAEDVRGQIEIFPEHEHALSDLDGFERIWILFWFHEVEERQRSLGKVLPPRSDRKRGVFATRSPHRPNPIGMSAVRLERVDGLVVHVRELDLLDGTPVVDIKPYIPYADAFPDANEGWLDAPEPRASGWSVRFTEKAEEQLAWLAAEGLVMDLRARISDALSLGPQPHPYRRIKKLDEGPDGPQGAHLLAVKEWRVRFIVHETDQPPAIVVGALFSGFRPRELASGTAPALPLHRAFAARFG